VNPDPETRKNLSFRTVFRNLTGGKSKVEPWGYVVTPFIRPVESNYALTSMCSKDLLPGLLDNCPGYISVYTLPDGDFCPTFGARGVKEAGLRFRIHGGGSASPHTHHGLRFLANAIWIAGDSFQEHSWKSWCHQISAHGDSAEKSYIDALQKRPDQQFTQKLIDYTHDGKKGVFARLQDDHDGTGIGIMELRFIPGFCLLSTECAGMFTMGNDRGWYLETIAEMRKDFPVLNSWAVIPEPDWSKNPPLQERVLWTAAHVLAVSMMIDNSRHPRRKFPGESEE